jgi:hypothetical protein
MKFAGVILSFLSVIIGTGGVYLDKSPRFERFRLRAQYLIAIAVATALLASGILIVGYIDARADARQKAASDAASENSRQTIEKISQVVAKMAPVVTQLPDLLQVIDKKLSRQMPSTVGVRVETGGTFRTGAGDEKGTAEEWRRFRDWLTSEKAAHPKQPTYMSITLNGSVDGGPQRTYSTYRVSLILAYLWAGTADADIESSLQARNFNPRGFVSNHGVPKSLLDFVVFLDERGAGVGFARADELASDLLAIELADKVAPFEQTFNKPLPIPLVETLKNLPSFRGAWHDTVDSAEIVRRMIEQSVDQVIIKSPRSADVFYVALSNAIKIL